MKKPILTSIVAALALIVGAVGFAAPGHAQGKSGKSGINPAVVLGVVSVVALTVLVAAGKSENNNRPVSP